MKNYLVILFVFLGLSSISQTGENSVIKLMGKNIKDIDIKQLLGDNYGFYAGDVWKSWDGGARIIFKPKGDPEKMSTQELLDSRYLQVIYVEEKSFDKYLYKDNMPFDIEKGMKYGQVKRSLKKNDVDIVNTDDNKIQGKYMGLSPFKNKSGITVEVEFKGAPAIIHSIKLSEPEK